jgi:uncharacterized RDD family membrane protein YckC
MVRAARTEQAFGMSRPPTDNQGSRPAKRKRPASKMLLAGLVAIVVIVAVLVLL